MESVGARRVFPCFDEPGWKINFDFTIRFKYPDEYTAIFNTQPISETIEGDYQTNVYHTTVPMPTYLLAFVISPYHTDSQARVFFSENLISNSIVYNHVHHKNTRIMPLPVES